MFDQVTVNKKESFLNHSVQIHAAVGLYDSCSLLIFSAYHSEARLWYIVVICSLYVDYTIVVSNVHSAPTMQRIPPYVKNVYFRRLLM